MQIQGTKFDTFPPIYHHPSHGKSVKNPGFGKYKFQQTDGKAKSYQFLGDC